MGLKQKDNMNSDNLRKCPIHQDYYVINMCSQTLSIEYLFQTQGDPQICKDCPKQKQRLYGLHMVDKENGEQDYYLDCSLSIKDSLVKQYKDSKNITVY